LLTQLQPRTAEEGLGTGPRFAYRALVNRARGACRLSILDDGLVELRVVGDSPHRPDLDFQRASFDARLCDADELLPLGREREGGMTRTSPPPRCFLLVMGM
jgi:hypothetical protein